MEVVKMVHGSSLYGTSTPTSDKDFKGIRLSSWEEIALGRIPKQYESISTGNMNSKNSKDDVDIEIFSLHTFIKEALEGQTFALDMLHAPSSALLVTSEIWKDLQKNRSKFYTKNIDSFVNYAMGQAAKYGVKGSRLSDAKNVIDWLELQMTIMMDSFSGINTRLSECNLTGFPTGEHIVWMDTEPRSVQVCQRNLQVTCKIGYLRDIVQKFYDQYGERAKLAATNDNVDWKALHHALRAGYQTKAIFKYGGFEYPLRETQFLVDVKQGLIPYIEVAEYLEELIDEIKVLKYRSKLPEKSDEEFWDKWLINVVESMYFKR